MRHELQVELFRNRPALAVKLLATMGELGTDLEALTARLASIDLSEATPAELRCDACVELERDGRLVGGVIVEIQRERDPQKRYTWPAYVAVAASRLRCPVKLLVVALKPSVARWAKGPFEVGHPGFVLRPIVLGAELVPIVTDVVEARAMPELAVLSALAHPDAEVAEAAYAGMAELPDDLRKVYWDMILAALPDAARTLLEAKMIKNYEYQSEFARKYYGQGRTEGREEGRQEALAAALRSLLAQKFGTVSPDALELVEGASVEELTRYLERILTARSVAEVFAAG